MKSYLVIGTFAWICSGMLASAASDKQEQKLEIYELYADLFDSEVGVRGREVDMLIINAIDPEGFSSLWLLTETEAYNAIKRNPPKIATTYLAVPWHKLGTKGINALVQEFGSRRFNGGFTVINNFSWFEGLLLPFFEKIGINRVFTPCTRCGMTKYHTIEIVPFPYHAKSQVKPRESKDVFYSFIGSTPSWLIAHPVRLAIFSMDHPANAIVKQRNNFLDIAGFAEYENVLARSRYCLCPPGNASKDLSMTAEPGVMRFYEALCAGAIPVFINDDWLLPYGIDWDDCMVRVPEAKVKDIPTILASIPQKVELHKRQACYKAFAALSGENFISPIKRAYGLS